MNKSINLLKPMDEVISVIGDPVKIDRGTTNGLHTIAIKVQNFRGRIKIQASLLSNPTDNDWISVLPNGDEYKEYPSTSYRSQYPGETSIYGFNFSSNVVWIRAIVDRDYLIPSLASPSYISTFGLVDYILLNY